MDIYVSTLEQLRMAPHRWTVAANRYSSLPPPFSPDALSQSTRCIVRNCASAMGKHFRTCGRLPDAMSSDRSRRKADLGLADVMSSSLAQVRNQARMSTNPSTTAQSDLRRADARSRTGSAYRDAPPLSRDKLELDGNMWDVRELDSHEDTVASVPQTSPPVRSAVSTQRWWSSL
ncbi:hypothetical protein AURDEDRAFT_173117 [Auricularia subglabra TFB-10046 SS5]|nr:hypothetical protein AURDEDRAFT_173117 [Auricularia subglabra TFB-10046 SS5]